MNFKSEVMAFLRSMDVYDYRLRYFKRSPYQARRYKPEYVSEEVWIYFAGQRGVCLTSDEWEEFGRRVLLNNIPQHLLETA